MPEACSWKVRDKDALGFSAGGHLEAALSNNHAERTYAPVDDADKLSCKPDFAVLVYPAYLTQKDKGEALTPEIAVSKANTPPTFLVMAQDDGVRVENVMFYSLALKNAKVPAEAHIYPTGGHGYGLRRIDNPVAWWPARAADWMKASGFLKRP